MRIPPSACPMQGNGQTAQRLRQSMADEGREPIKYGRGFIPGLSVSIKYIRGC